MASPAPEEAASARSTSGASDSYPKPELDDRLSLKFSSIFSSLIGAEYVTLQPSALEQFAVQRVVPGCIVSPGSSEQVAAILRICGENNWVVAPSGGHTQQHIGGLPERIDVLLSTRRLNAVQHYDPGDLTMGIGAGATISQIQAMLSECGQFLPIDSPQPHLATVGGAMMTSAQGPIRAGFGAVREFCIGLQFVTAEGKIAKGGGRVVKNVAGYDLMKLMIGSFGSLGVVVSANFKVFPQPRATRTFVSRFASLEAAIAFRDRVTKSPLQPFCLEIASPRAVEYLREPPKVRHPEEMETVAPHSGDVPADWKVFVRAAGSDAVLGRYRRELGGDVTSELTGDEEEQMWRWFSRFEESIVARHRNAMILHCGVPPAGVAEVLRAAELTALHHNFLFSAIGRIGAGSLVAAFSPIAVDPPSAMQYANAVSDLRGRLPRDASAWVIRCPLEAKPHFDVWGATSTDLQLMRRIKSTMDEKNILNRGRFMV